MVMLDDSYRWGCLGTLVDMLQMFRVPCLACLSRLTALYRPISGERSYAGRTRGVKLYLLLYPRLISLTLLYTCLILLTLPLLTVSLLVLIWIESTCRPAGKSRRYRISRGEAIITEPPVWSSLHSRRYFTLASADVTLVPDTAARATHNLANASKRAKEIGQRLVDSQISVLLRGSCDEVGGEMRSKVAETEDEDEEEVDKDVDYEYEHDYMQVPLTEPMDCADYLPLHSLSLTSSVDVGAAHHLEPLLGGSGRRVTTPPSSLQLDCSTLLMTSSSGIGSTFGPLLQTPTPGEVHSVTPSFPPSLDFLCLQSVHDHRASKNLLKKLHTWFHYILYDVGSLRWNKQYRMLLRSGLLFASRYPILEAKFRDFHSCVKCEKFADGKGLLMCKVHVGTTEEGHSIVGYVGNTHLYSGHDGSVRSKQLSSVFMWLTEFRRVSKEPDDVVVFDILAGDLHLDNMSTRDKNEYNHAIFSHYNDPCRLVAGQDKQWAVGTQLVKQNIYDEDVADADGLRRILEQEEKRSSYVVDIERDEIQAAEDGHFQGGNGKRRVDYILYNDDSLHEDSKMCVEHYSFISQLASLTDHIPVCMRFTVGGCQPANVYINPLNTGQMDYYKLNY